MKPIVALQRGLLVLDLLRRIEPSSLDELTRQSELPKPTVLRILRTLAESRVAYQGLSDRLWRVGSQMPTTRSDPVETILAEVAGPVLDRLCRAVLWPSDIGIFQDGAIRVLETSRRQTPFLVNRNVVTQRIHVYPSAMGRVILAWSSETERARILTEMMQSGDGPDRAPRPNLETELDAIRQAGYAKRERGYYVILPREGKVSAIGVPVSLGAGRIAAVNLSWFTSAMPEAEFVTTTLPALREAAREIEDALGRSRTALT